MEETNEPSANVGKETEALPIKSSAEENLSPIFEEFDESSPGVGEEAEALPAETSAEESLNPVFEGGGEIGIGESTGAWPGTGFSPDGVSPAFPAPIPRYLQPLPPRPASKVPLLIAVILALAAGMIAGGFVVRQRYRAREVVVAVNGSPIDQSDFYRRLESQSGDAVVRQMVGEELYLQFARSLGKTPDDAAVDAKVQELLTQPDFQKKFANSHLSLEDIKRQVRSQMARQSILTKDVPVTEPEARKFDKVNADPRNLKALFYTPEAASIEVIINPNRAQCESALHAIENGVPFENAVGVYSRDATRITGGQLPPILRGRTTSGKYPQLEEAIFSLKIGGTAGPINVAGSWWLIRCLDKSPAVLQTYEQVKEQCFMGAALAKLSNNDAVKIERNFVDFQKHSIIQAFWRHYAKAVDLK